MKQERIPLDLSLRCSDVIEFETELRRKVVGQEEAVIKTTEIIQRFIAGLNDASHPVGSLLLLGPTGTGKTRLVEAVCEVMFGTSNDMLRIDCAEFQQSHEVAKILGAPPGYVGHNESGGLISQKKLDKTHTDHVKLSVILFDEIEKAHANFWDLLLGILDKARLTDNHGEPIDFHRTLIFMTSNSGAREMVEAVEGGIGFISNEFTSAERMKVISSNAASKKFSPEFINRLDHIITFQHLSDEVLAGILEVESNLIQKRILDSERTPKFVFVCSDRAKTRLIEQGTSMKFGARYLKRTLDKYVVDPLSTFVLTHQVCLGDLVEIDYVDTKFTFHKIPARVIAESNDDEYRDFKKAIDE
jgi:ATP-dependent Clp protease ATP-binding subunit ClpA